MYTKAATKIYHRPGPPIFPIEGVSPHYAPSYIPANFMIQFISFPSLEKLWRQSKVGESEIAFELMGFNAAMAAANMATSNEEDINLFKVCQHSSLD